MDGASDDVSRHACYVLDRYRVEQSRMLARKNFDENIWRVTNGLSHLVILVSLAESSSRTFMF